MSKHKFLLFVLLMSAFSPLMASTMSHGVEIPIPLEAYDDNHMHSLWAILQHRIAYNPFNLVATIIFLASIIHTFFATKITAIAHRYQDKHDAKVAKGYSGNTLCYKAEILHFFGEVEAIFGIWLIPLITAIIYFYGWHTATNYINHKVRYTEPIFVVVIMIMASTKPVLKLAENLLRYVAALGKHSPAAWWMAILIIGPIFGSFITEPAAMTISAILLAKQFYDLKPKAALMYGTIGLLFVNISVGGTLTHFAAPPVLMVAGKWGWNSLFMLEFFGSKAFIGIVASTLLYYFVFRKEFARLKAASVDKTGIDKNEKSIPVMVTLIHLIFLAWTVFTLHHVAFLIGGLLFFLAFTHVTLNHQYNLNLRSPLLVGFFLAGLVTHGTLQQWWIEPVLESLSEVPLFLGATVLTAFNDNAAITFLASLVPSFAHDLGLQKAVVMGAVTGGGLTVIANAPNPAGQSILSKYFPDGVSPLGLLFGALVPTVIVGVCFMCLPW